MRLSDSRVVVFGGSSGIGLAVAEAALTEGARVTIAGRDRGRLQEAAQKLGGKARTEQVDASDKRMLEDFFRSQGTVDHVVATVHSRDTTAGALRPILELDLEVAHRQMMSTYWTQFMILKLGAPFLSRKGSITLTSGAASRGYQEHHGLLGPSYAAIETLARYASREFGPRRVNCVSPGLTDTTAYEAVPPPARRRMFSAFAEGLPVGFVAKPQDVAGAYIYAMANDYVSGSVIDIDGAFMFGLLKKFDH